MIPGCGGDLFEMTFEEQTKCLRRKKIYGENIELANPKVSSLDGGMKMNSFFQFGELYDIFYPLAKITRWCLKALGGSSSKLSHHVVKINHQVLPVVTHWVNGLNNIREVFQG